MIVDFDGRILAQADPGPVEKTVVGPIDLAALRDARRTRQGHAFLNHLHDAYDQLFPDPPLLAPIK